MPDYQAPLRDMRFVFQELLNSSEITNLSGFEEIDEELIDAVLEEAGKFCSNVLRPAARSGDEEGCQLNNGEVRVPTA